MSITAARLRELLAYDPETGVFTRKVRTSNAVNVGDVAGSRCGLDYLSIRLDGKRYKAHRLAWLYVYGEWPHEQLDHINCVRVDNRIANLRQATAAQNKRNIGALKNNASGFKGVCWDKGNKKWRAEIRADGKYIFLGRFRTKKEAHEAYRVAAEKYHGEFARHE